MSVTIRCLGREPLSVSPHALEDTLRQQYPGEHVALHWLKTSTGMRRLMMVSMTDEGHPLHSHTSDPIDFAQIHTELGLAHPHMAATP